MQKGNLQELVLIEVNDCSIVIIEEFAISGKLGNKYSSLIPANKISCIFA